MLFWIGQAFGAVGLLACLFAFQCKENRRLIFLQLCADTCYAVQFFLLGGYTGCITLGIAMLSDTLQCFHGRGWADWKGWRLLLCAMYVACTALTWQNPFSILPCVGAIAATLSIWSRNGKTLRLARLAVVGPCWLVYDFYTGALAGVLCQLLSMGSILVSIRRYGLKNLDKIS